jgi:hypothetical protein
MAVLNTELDYGGVITGICKLVGHAVTVTDPAGSSDSAIQQMGAVVNVALGDLLTLHEWQDLTVMGSIPIIADTPGQKEKAFDLPLDFYRFVDQSQWGGQTMLPALGPVSNQAWMQYTVRTYTPQLTLFWQMRGDKLVILNPPNSTVDFQFMYISNAQVIDIDDPNLFKNVASKNGDRFKLDSYMIMLLSRAKYLEGKGFDASAAMRDFLSVFQSRAGANRGASVLSLNSTIGLPFLNPWVNLPSTGFGG